MAYFFPVRVMQVELNRPYVADDVFAPASCAATIPWMPFNVSTNTPGENSSLRESTGPVKPSVRAHRSTCPTPGTP